MLFELMFIFALYLDISNGLFIFSKTKELKPYLKICKHGNNKSQLFMQSNQKQKTNIYFLIASQIIPLLSISLLPFNNLPVRAESFNLQSELVSYEEDLESSRLKLAKEPKNVMRNLKRKLNNIQEVKMSKEFSKNDKLIADAMERVLTLKAYLDEAERDLFSKNWENLQIYLYTFAEQENSFVTLIEQVIY
jgi:hypothetical protein